MTASTIPLGEKIELATALYARWRQRLVFRLTPLADEGLDQELERRGFAIVEPTYVQGADIGPSPISGDVHVFGAANDAWIDAAISIRELAGEDAAVFASQHRAVAIDSAWALIKVGEHPVAVGIAALERGWAGLHGIHVAKSVRHQGFARKLSQDLLGFAYARGARRAWLQVAQANTAALPLYHSLGFRTVYSYHHRVVSM